jgi:membrane protein YdbS with pleckstrin-like domain
VRVARDYFKREREMFAQTPFEELLLQMDAAASSARSSPWIRTTRGRCARWRAPFRGSIEGQAAMTAPDSPAGAGDRVVFRTTFHPIVLSGAASLAAVVLGIVALVVHRNPLSAEAVRPLWLAGVAIVVVGAVAPVWRWWRSEFAVTSERLVVRTGVLGRRAIDLPLAKVETIEVQQGLIGRLLGYGTLGIVGGDGTAEAFARVARPDALRDAVRRHAPPAVRRRVGGASPV